MPRLKPGTIIPTPEEASLIAAGIAVDPDARELDEAWFEQARPAREVMSPTLYAALTEKRPRGRPKAAETKVFTGLRLDPDVLAALRATGPGWQTRVNAILRERFVS